MKLLSFGLIFCILLSCNSNKEKVIYDDVVIVGKMKDVMQKGNLYGKINLDTISIKRHLYGLGPIEYLKGEIVIIDGKAFIASIISDSSMQVLETYKIKAPFFAYANIEKWNEQTIPDWVLNVQQLERYLYEVSKSRNKPFFFKLRGKIDSAKIHVVNLPSGTKVTNPKEAHIGQKNFLLENEQSEIIGFFSTEHKAIFTHHDSYIHMHLITMDRKKMGHLDEVFFQKKAMKLYLPIE